MEYFRIQNIKSFKDSNIILNKQLTILVGKNSCGKSSLLRFLAVLSQTAQKKEITDSPISFIGSEIDYGSFKDVIFGNDKEEEMSFTLAYKINKLALLNFIRSSSRYIDRTVDGRDILFKPYSMNISVSIKPTLKFEKEKIVVTDFSVFLNNELYLNIKKDNHAYSFETFKKFNFENGSFFNNNNKIFIKDDNFFGPKIFFPNLDEDDLAICILPSYFVNSEQKEKYEKYCERFFSNNVNYFPPLYIAHKILGDTDQYVNFSKEYSNLVLCAKIINGVYHDFITEFGENFKYIGPFRVNPERIYRNTESTNFKVGSKGEYSEDLLFSSSRSSNKEVFNSTSKWLKKHFGYKIKINKIGSSYYQLLLENKFGFQSNIIDVGYGISQILPIVTQIYSLMMNNNEKECCIAIEQPELHLHPSAQSKLAHLFADFICNNPSNHLVIETHSEHLISKLQVLIANNKCPLNKDMVQFLYVDKNEEGVSSIKEMKIADDGTFYDEWPTGFFDEGFNLSLELFNIEK